MSAAASPARSELGPWVEVVTGLDARPYNRQSLQPRQFRIDTRGRSPERLARYDLILRVRFCMEPIERTARFITYAFVGERQFGHIGGVVRGRNL